ncbi:hypothetical protein AX16_001700 [Volvariella volvacea WC 439]|nr:hypothetical protein AX16_001700 [Volvariella volvacea WC 439]
MTSDSLPKRYDIHDNLQAFNDRYMGGYSRTIPLYNPQLQRTDGTGIERVLTQARFALFRFRNSIVRKWRYQQVAHRFSLVRPTGPHLTNSSSTSNLRFIFLCALWYTSSALSSNTGKAILMQFRYPITLTFVQFGFVAFYCLLFMSPVVRFTRLRMPSQSIIRNTLPMGFFQVGGHMFSSIAISRIPVSTVHTIKALSPLFTVAAYALLFGVSYSAKTYVSLLPLTIGVMLACSFDMSASNVVGLVCAFGSALVFVSSNIFFKKIMPTNNTQSSSHKLDKLNLLLYSSGMAFILMLPIWAYYDLPVLFSGEANGRISHPVRGHTTSHSVTYYFVMNGTVHFAQNIIAFVILSSTSPVTYSIASLIKRVAVICIAIIWFNQSVHPVQAMGIALTFTGLYMYNNAKSDVEQGEKKMRRVEAARGMMLPTIKEAATIAEGFIAKGSSYVAPEVMQVSGMGVDTVIHGRPRGPSMSGSHPGPLHRPLPPKRQVPPLAPLPNISIKVTPPQIETKPSQNGRVVSPVDSYPSPPDSPPHHHIPFNRVYGNAAAIPQVALA